MRYIVYDDKIASDILIELVETEVEIRYIRQELKKFKCGCSGQAKLLQKDMSEAIAYYNYLDSLSADLFFAHIPE